MYPVAITPRELVARAPTGRHQWTVFITYGLTDAEAAALEAGGEQRLDEERRVSIDGPGCVNCEETYTAELAAKPCPAPWYVWEPADAQVVAG